MDLNIVLAVICGGSCTCRSVLCCVSDLSYDCYRRNSQRIKAP